MGQGMEGATDVRRQIAHCSMLTRETDYCMIMQGLVYGFRSRATAGTTRHGPALLTYGRHALDLGPWQ